MAVADLLRDIGEGVKTGGKAAGAAALPVLQRTAEVVSGEAPKIDEDDRRRAEKLEDEQINAKATMLENQLATAQKYGTLTPEQQQQYADQLYGLYNKPRHAQVLMEKLRKAVHPDGAYAEGPQVPLKDAAPPGGTAQVDVGLKEAEAEKLAAAKYHTHPANPQQQYYDSFARKLGLENSTEMNAEQWEQAFKEKKQSDAKPVNWRNVRIAGNLYAQNPQTLEMKFIAKDSEVTESRSVQNITVGDPPHLIQVPVTRYTSKVTGHPIVDQEGNPIETQDEGGARVAGALNAPPQESPGQTPAKKVNPGSILPKTGAKPVTSQPRGVANAINLPGVGNLPKGARDFGTKGPSIQEKTAQAAAAKQMPVLDAAEGTINDYVNGGVYDGAGDLSLQHAFFTATQPSTGFRMTKVQQDILQNSRSWTEGIKGQLHHATTGTWYTDEQRQQIAKAALDAIREKRKALNAALAEGADARSGVSKPPSDDVIVVTSEDMK